MNRPIRLALACACFAAATAGCGEHIVTTSSSPTTSASHGFSITINPSDAKYTSIETKTVTTGSAPKLVVDEDIGDITVANGSPNAVSIVATKHAASQEDLPKLILHVDQSGNTVHVFLERPKLLVNNLWADFKITAPAGSSIQASTTSGDVTASGFSGDVNTNTGNGDIHLTAISGSSNANATSGQVTAKRVAEVIAQTGNGDIDVEYAAGAVKANTASGQVSVKSGHGAVDAETGNGDIRIAGRQGSVDARTRSGQIELSDIEGKISVESGNGDIHVRGGRAHGTLSAETTSGGVDIATDASTFQISSGNGDIKVATSAAPVGSSSISATSGGVDVAIPSTSNIRLDASATSGSISTSGLTISDATKSSDSSLSGTIGTGANGSLHIETGSGDITISGK